MRWDDLRSVSACCGARISSVTEIDGDSAYNSRRCTECGQRPCRVRNIDASRPSEAVER